jgi:hypothetical protein
MRANTTYGLSIATFTPYVQMASTREATLKISRQTSVLPPLVLAVGGALPMAHARKIGTAWDRCGDDYAYTRELEGSGWAWEFLRRNGAYCFDYRMNRAGQPMAVSHVSGATIYRPQRRFLAAEWWGLSLFADPNKSALDQDIFWLPTARRHAVQCQTNPSNDSNSEALSLETFCGRRAVLALPELEQISIRAPRISADLINRCGTMLFGSSNVSFLHHGIGTASRHHETLRILQRLTQKTANDDFRSEPQSNKYHDYLVALEGRLAGLSYRDIAEILYGPERIGPCWADDSRGYKSKIIRAAKSGLALMNGGYRDLL